MSHAMHAPPAVPHDAVDAVMHDVPEQQPSGHVAALQLAHAPLMHTPPLPHALHVPPPVPHAPFVVPPRHVVPEQHPLHERPSHTQEPPMQCWPVTHGALPPHVHAPLDEQPSLAPFVVQSTQNVPAVPHDVPERGKQLAPAQQPPPHDIASHTHAPEMQR
jgi:hypothetical protein